MIEKEIPVYSIFACEIGVFSFLIGAFMNSLILGFMIFSGSGLVMYTLFQRFYTFLPLVWGATLLGWMTTFLWTSYIDRGLGTNFMAILLSLSSGFFCYVLNERFFKRFSI